MRNQRRQRARTTMLAILVGLVASLGLLLARPAPSSAMTTVDGACSPGTRPTDNGCVPITCPTGQTLEGSQCVPITCPTGQAVYANQCVSFPCPGGGTLIGRMCGSPPTNPCTTGFSLSNPECCETTGLTTGILTGSSGCEPQRHHRVPDPCAEAFAAYSPSCCGENPFSTLSPLCGGCGFYGYASFNPACTPPPLDPCAGYLTLSNPLCSPPPPVSPPPSYNPPPQTYPPPTGATCADGSFAPSLAACPQSYGPPASPPPSSPPPPSTGPQTPPVGVSFSSSGPGSVTVSLHNNTNQTLDFTHSVTLNLAPGVQATGVTVSTGTGAIQGNTVVWNGFTLGPGQDASVTVTLAATSSSAAAATGTAAVQSVSITAVDQSGNQIVEQAPGGGLTVDQLPSAAPGTSACVDASGTALSNCNSSSEAPRGVALVLRLSWRVPPQRAA